MSDFNQGHSILCYLLNEIVLIVAFNNSLSVQKIKYNTINVVNFVEPEGVEPS